MILGGVNVNSISVLLFGIFLIVGVIYIFLGGYIIYMNIHARLNCIFGAVAASLAIWAFSFAWAILAPDYTNALFWRRISSIGWGFFYALMVQFILNLLENSSLIKSKKNKNDFKHLFLYIPAVINVYVFGISAELSGRLYNLTRTQFGWRNIALKTVWDYFFIVYYVSYSLIGIGLLIIFSRRTRLIREKKQSVIIVSSFIICFLAGTVTDIILDYYIGIELPESGVIFLLLPIIAIWFSIKKYGLMDLTLGTVSEDILSRMNEGLLLVDSKGDILSVNNSLIRLSGYLVEEIVGKKIETFLNRKGYKADSQPTWDKLIQSDLEGIEEFIVIKNGDKIPILLSSTRIFDQWGDLIGVVCILINVSEIRAREIDLLYVQKDLKIALRKVNVAVEAKSQFLATMSHEIRTPMNSIIGMSYLTLQTDLNDTQRDYVNKIQTSATTLLNILNDILDFAKIDSGKIQLEQVAFDMDKTISKAIDRVVEKADEKQLAMLYHYPKELPKKVIGDPIKVEQILTKLIHNAVKFTEAGEIEISVSEQEREIERICLRFTVRDTGIGIALEDKEIIFQEFRQIDSSTTRQYEGTGLGLAITKNLVEMMEGRIWVESQLGKGSTFTFYAWFQIDKEDEKGRDYKARNYYETDIQEIVPKQRKVIIKDIMKEIEELLTLLSRGDSLALDQFERVSEAMKQQLRDEDYNYISARLSSYEFDEAGERLKEVIYGQDR